MNDALRDHPLHYSVHSRLRAFHLRRMLPRPAAGRLLDVGCGLGYLILALGREYQCFGLEPDEHACKTVVARGAQGAVRGLATRLPIAPDSCEVILCSEVLEHLPDGEDLAALREMARILKPGGRLLITVPALEGMRAHSTLRNLGHQDPGGGEYHYRIGYAWPQLASMIEAVPGLTLVSRRFAMVILAELFMDLLKWVYFRKHRLKEHSDLMAANDSLLFRVYRRLFPLLHWLFLLEDLVLSPLLSGHIHLISLTKGS